MEIKNDKFYVLEADEKKIIVDTETEAIAELKKLKEKEDAKILEVDVSDEDWEVKQLAWSKIAMKLLE